MISLVQNVGEVHYVHTRFHSLGPMKPLGVHGRILLQCFTMTNSQMWNTFLTLAFVLNFAFAICCNVLIFTCVM